ncbi:MAG: zinc ribbon domain-containing protein [Candidatus Helarchaeota archaeon]
MSENKEKKSEEEEDLLSLVDSLLDSPDDKNSKVEIKKDLKPAPKKSKVVPVIVRPPKKLKPKLIKPVPIQNQIKPMEQKIYQKEIDQTTQISTSSLTTPIEEKPSPKLSLDELAATVLDELESDLEPSETTVKTEPAKFEFKYEAKKKETSSSYSIKFGTHKKLESLEKDLKVRCPNCGHFFESLETEDIICPKCYKMFNK